MSKRLVGPALAASFCMMAGPVAAIEGITLNGFMTVGATKSNSDISSEDGNITDSIGFENDTRVGVQITADINENMSATAQMLGRAREENFDAFFDWGFIDYEVDDNLHVRAGKLKFPTFLISDYFEIGYAYPWIRGPQEVYDGNPITTITGIDVLFRTNVGVTDILVQPYFGTSKGATTLLPQEVVPALSLPAGSVVFVEFEAENLAGINVQASTDVLTLRAGYLETDVNASSLGINNDDKATFLSVGGTLDWNDFIVYAEYFEREIDGQANGAFPNQKGWYTTVGRRFGKFLPHFTYASLGENDSPVGGGLALEQDSMTLGLRYELGGGAALKAEAQRVEPEDNTRGLFISPPGDVNIYSVAVDVVF